MFSVDEATAEAIRRAYDEDGELAGVVAFRRHFPLITDNAKAGECVRIIAGWKPMPLPDRKPRGCLARVEGFSESTVSMILRSMASRMVR